MLSAALQERKKTEIQNDRLAQFQQVQDSAFASKLDSLNFMSSSNNEEL